MERQLEHAECMYAEELPETTVEILQPRPSVKRKQALAQSLIISVNIAEAKQLSLFAQQD